MFFAQKMHDKFSRISLSLPGQKYAILNSAYLPRAGELLSEYERRDLFMNKTRVRLAALLLAVSFALSGCSLVKNIGGSSGAGTKTITRPAVESAELQFTHPAAGEPVAVFDTTAGVFKPCSSRSRPRRPTIILWVWCRRATITA